MAIANINARFQFQKMTKAEWEEWGDILLDGELAYEADTTKMKMGDGEHKYIDLPYIEIGEISVSDLSEEEIKKVTGPKGEKGEKGEAPLVFSSNPPEDKKVLWIKNNVRNIYVKINLNNDDVVYYGKVCNIFGSTDHKALLDANVAISNTLNIELNSIDAIKVEEKVIIPIKTKLSPVEYGRYILLRVSDEDLKFLSKALGNIGGDYSENGYGANYVNLPDYTINEFKLMKKINEEKYLTLNVYNPINNKWEKIE